jgi:hypothetical protein
MGFPKCLQDSEPWMVYRLLVGAEQQMCINCSYDSDWGGDFNLIRSVSGKSMGDGKHWSHQCV